MEALIAAVLAGLAIGIFSGLLGIGGGTLMVPLFRLVFGMSPLASTATSLFTIIPTSLSGAVTHVRNRTCVPKLGIALGLGGACTSSLGVLLAQHSPGWAIMAAAAAVIAYSAITMFRKAWEMKKPDADVPAVGSTGKSEPMSTGQSAGRASTASKPATQASNLGDQSTPTSSSPDDSALSMRQLAIGFGIGAAAGIISGFVGVGGGFIMVPLMLTFMNLPMKRASGTSLIAVMILATPATIMQCVLGNVDFVAGIAIACGSIPGALIGARLVKRVPERTLRFVFGCFLLVAAILLITKETGIWG